MPTSNGNGHGIPAAAVVLLPGEERLTAIASLREYPGNARRTDLAPIAESLEVNGQYTPIIVQASTNQVLVGNHRMKAARDVLGWDTILARFVDVDDDHARRIVLADNRTSDVGGWDDSMLSALLAAADDAGGLLGTGYQAEDMAELLAASQPYPEPDDAPPVTSRVPPDRGPDDTPPRDDDSPAWGDQADPPFRSVRVIFPTRADLEDFMAATGLDVPQGVATVTYPEP